MKLDAKDIEAVAKSRVVRQEGTKGLVLQFGGMAIAGVGVLLVGVSRAVAWGLVGAGFLIFFFYVYSLSQKQNNYKQELLSEWEAEQKE